MWYFGGIRESATYAVRLEPILSITSWRVTTTPSPTLPQFTTASPPTAIALNHQMKETKQKKIIV